MLPIKMLWYKINEAHLGVKIAIISVIILLWTHGLYIREFTKEKVYLCYNSEVLNDTPICSVLIHKDFIKEYTKDADKDK
jgi:hypothetical protein